MNSKQFVLRQFQLPNNITTFLFLLLSVVNMFIYVQNLSVTNGVKIIVSSNLTYNQNYIWFYFTVVYLINTILSFLLENNNKRFNLFFVFVNGLLLSYWLYLSCLSILNL